MQVHHGMDHLTEIPFPVVTVGSFDGVHAGHRVILGRLNQLAAQVGGASVLITFSPHPRKVLYPDTAGKDLMLINSQAEKIKLLEGTGLDHLIIMEFTRDFSRTPADRFVEHYLVKKLQAHTIVVGFNHYFGYNKGGNFDSLYRVREIFGFRVEEIPEQEIQNETVSSTKIRKALVEGNIQRANAYLEHYYFIAASMGPASRKSSVGELPCFEVDKSDDMKLIPPSGGYAVSCLCDQQIWKGFVWIGEDRLLLFPLDAMDMKRECEGEIRFHKCIAIGGEPDPIRALAQIRELIY